MDKDKFKLRLDIKTGKEDIDLYIWELHNYLIKFETSSVKQMLISLDTVAQKITDDLDCIANGDLGGLQILSDDKDSKIFDKVQKIVEKIDNWKRVSEMAEGLRPEVEERKSELKDKKPQIKIDTSANVVEQLLKSK
jgi:hypothetical protein